ncbi:MAG: radical SAM family heme chaperone HemW [Lachnospiraceae bacterium]
MKKNQELELYVHIPFCVKKCAYCDFLSGPAPERTQVAYVNALLKEMTYYGRLFPGKQVSTIYVGGGTPSWLQESYMEQIFETIYREFQVKKDAEISIECNPGTLTKNKLLAYQQMGINRLSIGLQSTLNEELKLLGRIHTYEQFLKNYEMARQCGFENINIDIMSSLPYQTPERFAQTLSRVIRLQPEHISSYSLIIEKGTPFYETYKFDAVKRHAGMQTEMLPSEDTEAEIDEMTRHFLKQAGYHYYEISNYAKPGYECRHNIGYWTRQDYLGLGLGAASLISDIRFSNTRDLDAYILNADQIEEKEFPFTLEGEPVTIHGINLHESAQVLSRKDQMEEFMFLGLRLCDGIERIDFQQTFGTSIDAVYGSVLEELVENELLIRREGKIRLSDRGREISNYVLSQFLLD